MAKKESVQLVVLASTHKPVPMPKPTDICAVIDASGPETSYECGHRHPERFAFDFYGEKIEMIGEYYAARKLCANCHLAELKKQIIRCAKCGFVIMPGGSVVLYRYKKKLLESLSWVPTVVGAGRHKSFLACMRPDCCLSAGFFAGKWAGDHFQSAFIGGSAAGEVMRTGRAVVVNIKESE